MRTDIVYLLGAGGHAKVVVDALLRERSGEVDIQVIDDNTQRRGSQLLGLLIQSSDCNLSGERFHVAIGENAKRSKRFYEIARSEGTPTTVIHPMASVAATVRIEHGAFVAALSTIGPDTIVGRGAIINHGAVVDHDCILGEFCHIAPGSVLGGGVEIGERVLVGAGAVVLAGISVASDVIIGAGAVLTHSIRQSGTYVGVPAREIRKE